MSKQNNNSDPLEEFFKEKSQEYDIEYREEDWQKLETRLDKADQLRWQRRRKWLAAAVIAMLFAVLAYISYDQQLKINELTDKLNNQEQLTTNRPSDDLGADEATDPNENERTENRDSEPTDDVDQSADNSVPSTQDEATLQNELTLNQEVLNSEQPDNQILALSTVEITEKSLLKASPGFDGRTPAISAIKPIESQRPGKMMTLESSQAPDAEPKRLAHQPTSRLNLGVVVGPDLSTVGGMSDFYDPGYKFGISIEYNITQNLAVSVGAQRTKVQYLASGNEYSPPEGYWSYGVTPEETQGICVLIDIPISLKYNLMHFDHSRLYATTGLSSYIMLDEDYRFSYETSQPGLKQRWHEKTGTTHLMSNATLSVGYELDFTRALSLRAEPFLKLPIKEVGWGNVNLYSMGSLISVNYRIN